MSCSMELVEMMDRIELDKKQELQKTKKLLSHFQNLCKIRTEEIKKLKEENLKLTNALLVVEKMLIEYRDKQCV